MLIYLAGPHLADISFISPRESNYWRNLFADELDRVGVAAVCFDPWFAFGATVDVDIPQSAYGPVTDVNRAAIHNCSMLIANMGQSVSLGTAREIQIAKAFSKPVIVIFDPNRPLSISTHDLVVVYDIPSAARVVAELARL